tara:strand:- start:3233 stop:3583 length:351 start_codon:yes stop_codon:yes gene_type:complete
MTVFVKNLIINVGEDFTEDLEIFSADGSGVVDLTNFTAQSQLRKHPDSIKFVGIAVSITSPEQGRINISIADTVTSSIKPGRHVYDVLLTRPGGDKLIGVEGTALVRPGISTGFFS